MKVNITLAFAMGFLFGIIFIHVLWQDELEVGRVIIQRQEMTGITPFIRKEEKPAHHEITLGCVIYKQALRCNVK